MSRKQRLFFALWPSPQLQATLADWGARVQQSLGGRLTRSASVHLTLVFIGDVDDSAIDNVRRAGDAQNAAAIDLLVDRVGCWNHNGVAWAAPRETPPSLISLVTGLESGLRAAGFDMQTRPYRPHVTLLRRAHCRAVDWQPSPLRWHADRFVLVRSQRSQTGVDYQRLAEWPLADSVSPCD